MHRQTQKLLREFFCCLVSATLKQMNTLVPSSEKFTWFDLNHVVQPKGTTLPIEFDDTFPFPVKRIYTVTGTPGHIRGGHAHQKEEEVFICVAGSVTATVDVGTGPKNFIMHSPKKALWVKTLCWHEFSNFSPDAVLLCISSVHYTPGATNYITSLPAFYAHLKSNPTV